VTLRFGLARQPVDPESLAKMPDEVGGGGLDAVGPSNSFVLAFLFLEKVVEGLAGVGGLGADWSCSFLLGGDADRVEGAGVLHVLAQDALRNGLHAFEPFGWIEIRALLAGMQLEAALRHDTGISPRVGSTVPH